LSDDKTLGYILGTAIPDKAGDSLTYEKDTVSGDFDNLSSEFLSTHFRGNNFVKGILKDTDLTLKLPNFGYFRNKDTYECDIDLMNMFGGGFHSDPFMTYIKQSHSCGVWAYSFDELLKVLGRSVSIDSLISEFYTGLDEGESYGFHAIATYIHEAFGRYLPDVEELYEKKDALEALDKPGTGFYELTNEYKDITPFYRLQRYYGFLGQGGKTSVFIPPKDLENKEGVPRCVANCQTHLDGTVIIESAKGIHLVRHPNIRSYKRRRAIGDPKGDDMKAGFKFESAELPNRPSAKSISDTLLYAVRGQAVHTFAAHSKDFKRIEKEENLSEKDAASPDDLTVLISQPNVVQPEPVDAYIDERYEEVKIPTNRSYITLQDDRTAIRGPSGEEILFKGGNIYLNCPGNIFLNGGGSVINMAGDDIVLKAKNSIDIQATDNDVRIKAEVNAEIVSGVGGKGRLLVENQSQSMTGATAFENGEGESLSANGLFLRAKDTLLHQLGKTVYVQSKEGDIVLHSNKNITEKCKSTIIEVDQSFSIDIAQRSNLVNFGSRSALLKCGIRLYGSVEVDGSLTAHRSINTEGNVYAEGSFVSDRAKDNGGKVSSPLEPDQIEEMNQEPLTNLEEQVKEMEENLQERYYDESGTGFGSDIAYEKNRFSYRTSQQAGVNRIEFLAPYYTELYSQTMVEQLPLWEEKPYPYQEGKEQMAWPGKDAWEKKEVVYEGGSGYDPETGLDSDNEGEEGNEYKSKVLKDFLRVLNP
jgi:flagellar basal body rod protein FlgG